MSGIHLLPVAMLRGRSPLPPFRWIIQTPRGFSNGVINGQIATFKVEPGNFGKWQINLNVRDSVQMLNGHLSTSIDVIKK